jgi:hypothetical protein
VREVIEDTLDRFAAWCGVSPPPRAPRHVRRAVRALASDAPADRLYAERELLRDRIRATPLLSHVARSSMPGPQAVRAALLLHRFDERLGADLLRRMVRDPALRAGPDSDSLRQAARELVCPVPYTRQAASSVTQLEQRPESFRAIARFRQAAEILRFLGAGLPEEVLKRALVVRTVGGENLSLVRQVIAQEVGVDVEHVCMVRMEAAHCIVAAADQDRAYNLLTEHLAHPNSAVKLTAMYGLGILGDPRAVDPLHALAQDADNPVRADAQRLIERLDVGAPDVLTLLRAADGAHAPNTLLRSWRQAPPSEDERLLRPMGTE